MNWRQDRVPALDAQSAADKLVRIARILEEGARSEPASASGPAESREARIALVRAILASRRAFEARIGQRLFADPVRDMLLELYASELEYKRASVTFLVEASRTPPTTALRALRALTAQGLVLRENDPTDKRRVFVRLSQSVRDQIEQWLETAVATGPAA